MWMSGWFGIPPEIRRRRVGAESPGRAGTRPSGASPDYWHGSSLACSVPATRMPLMVRYWVADLDGAGAGSSRSQPFVA